MIVHRVELLSSSHLLTLERSIAIPRARLLGHPIYAALDSQARLRVFAEHHVFAVWDFMSLLKGLQQHLTCVSTPWLPTSNPSARRLVNEIVLGEESDDDGSGGHLSHFELYLGAMDDFGADSRPARQMCAALASGKALVDALCEPSIPAPARDFVASTFAVLDRGRPAEIAAAFALGREDVIPEMFRRFVATLHAASPARYERLRFYLARHIEIDGAEHGPKSKNLLGSLCGDDPVLWHEAEQAALFAIDARTRFWDEVYAAMSETRASP